MLPMALMLLLVATGPQAAAEDKPLVGEGAAPTGSESITTDPADPPPEPPFCLAVTASTYTFPIEEGVFEGDHNLVVYTVTPLDAAKPVVTFTTNETYYIAPEGTYGNRLADGTCDPASYGPLDPVSTTVTVTGGGITCGPDPAEYYRVNTELVFEWTGRCDIVGNTIPGTGYTPEATQHLFEATLVPPAPPTKGVWAYEYTPPL
jgi:hypothetical protein